MGDTGGVEVGDDAGEAGGGDAAAVEEDAGPVDDGGPGLPDAGSDAGSDAGGACFVSPFDGCDDPLEPPRDDEWHSAVDVHDVPFGCYDDQNPEHVEELSFQYDGTLCQLEPGDFYEAQSLSCDDRAVILELRLAPRGACADLSLVEIALFAGGGEPGCDTERYTVECFEEEGAKVLRMLLPTTREIHPLVFGVRRVDPEREDVQFPYSLTIDVR